MKNGKSVSDSEKQNDLEGQTSQDSPYCALSLKRKTIIIGIVTIAGCLGPISGNIYIPILPQLENEFHISTQVINGTVSAFMFVFAIAPLLWASWADYGGRKTLYLIPLIFSYWLIYCWQLLQQTSLDYTFCEFYKHLVHQVLYQLVLGPLLIL